MDTLTLENQTCISFPTLKSSKFRFRSPTISMHFPPTLKSNSLFRTSSSNNQTTIPFSTKIHCLDSIHNQPLLDKLGEEENGVVGIYNHPEASRLCYHALHALHYSRDQKGVCSIVTSKEGVFRSLSGVGTVLSDVFDGCKLLDHLPGDSAIGYIQYSNVTPTFVDSSKRFGSVNVAYSGTLKNYDALRCMLEDSGVVFDTNSHAEVVLHLFYLFKARPSLISKIIGVCQQLEGNYSMVLLTDDNKLVAVVRDQHGGLPLDMGRSSDSQSLAMGRRSDGAIVFAPHSCALDAIDAIYVRELRESEIVVVDKDGGVQSFSMIRHQKVKLCIFEPLYMVMRNISKQDDKSWRADFDFKTSLGVILATDSPVDCDIVISGFKSSILPCRAFADTVGVPYDRGFVIEKNQEDEFVNDKLELEGKRVVVVAESIVSVTLCSKSVRLVRELGAKEVHMRIARPEHIGLCYEGAMVNYDKRVSIEDRVGWCHYDEDAPTSNKMPTSKNTISAEEIGADSLAFLSMDSLIKWLGSDSTDDCFSRGCSILPTKNF